MKTSLDKQAIHKINKKRAALMTKYFVIKEKESDLALHRVAFAFSRKVGKAVTRNRYKRRLRELISASHRGFKGHDLFVIARKSLETLNDFRWQTEKQAIQSWFETHQSIGHSSYQNL